MLYVPRREKGELKNSYYTGRNVELKSTENARRGNTKQCFD